MNQSYQSFEKLEQWLNHNGWLGFDPYDIKGSKFYLKSQKIPIIRSLLSNWIELFPRDSRTFLRIRPTINAKAMALFARGYLNLFHTLGNENYLEKARYCLNWLLDNPSPGYSGYCWGYPFDWQSVIFIPKGTPSGVVTSQAAHAFMDAYDILHEKRYLDAAESCCAFFLKDLNIDSIDDNSLCFSYTPIDTYHVHNANLWVASVLIRMWTYSKKIIHKDVALKAYTYTINCQNPDGSWVYWGPPDAYNKVIDNYHTGFNLECLNTARRILLEDWEWNDALNRGLDYYLTHLFLEDGTPRLTAESTYPIDIHSCAQAIITFSEMADFRSEMKNMAKMVANWTIINMQDQGGFFYYRKYKNHINKMPYIRWGQAWMLRALSYLIV